MVALGRQCIHRRFFNNDPAELEKGMAGLRVMGSGHSSVVSMDGIYSKLDRYLSGSYSYDLYERAEESRTSLALSKKNARRLFGGLSVIALAPSN